ncbi:MAG: 1-acyl-sn-glycerol-3-phosphate acyltransferase [Clostridia bacterium]|nr:1-acyl-sn-glycerol-3-phosphate acyltransferase [Clostridia bacterium]
MSRPAPCNVPVFFACDDRFAKFTAVSLTSIRQNASRAPGCKYTVHILHTGLSKASESLLSALSDDRFDVRFEDVTGYLAALADRFPLRDYYSKTTYFRLFIPDMFPEYEKAIYIDSDTVVEGDIRELFDTELTEGDYLAAAREQVMVQSDVFGTYVESALGISRYNFFNAGVLVLNCTVFRELKMLERFVRLLNIYEFRVTQDEDYLNVLCKDHVRWLDPRWNTEIFGTLPCPADEAKVLHFIMTAKPWHYRGAPLGDRFWFYAKQTDVCGDILAELNGHTDEQKEEDKASAARLEKLAESETAREDNYLSRLRAGQDPGRVAILKKIGRYEREGRFAEDVEDDPPTKPLLPDQIEYIRTGFVAKIKTKAAYAAARKFVFKLLQDKAMIIREIRGVEHMRNLQEGAVITCNHFNAFDSFAIQLAYESAGRPDKTFYRVIREGNYTSFPGFYGFLMRNCNTLPLSSNLQTMKKFTEATGTLLKRGDFVLVYPEQSMWWNYRKPKPLQKGAFIFAARNMVPVLPCFITMKDSPVTGPDGFPVQEYTVHISEPIYPDPDLPYGKNVQLLMDRNGEIWKEIYEREYGIPLSYAEKAEEKEEEGTSSAEA